MQRWWRWSSDIQAHCGHDREGSQVRPGKNTCCVIGCPPTTPVAAVLGEGMEGLREARGSRVEICIPGRTSFRGQTTETTGLVSVQDRTTLQHMKNLESVKHSTWAGPTRGGPTTNFPTVGQIKENSYLFRNILFSVTDGFFWIAMETSLGVTVMCCNYSSTPVQLVAGKQSLISDVFIQPSVTSDVDQQWKTICDVHKEVITEGLVMWLMTMNCFAWQQPDIS